MEQQTSNISGSFISSQEWTRLVRLCATLTSNKDIAEDLAQETVLEAWRHKHELRAPEKRIQWLSGIARNVCLRWLRTRGRELAHLANVETYTEQGTPQFEEMLADDYDIEVELERKELIELLDRAMALLSPEMRAVLVKRYVEESSLAEVAAQLGTNTSAVAMRIQRGKLALHRVLTTQMSNEISAYSVSSASDHTWEETRIWCMLCGQRRLMGKIIPNTGDIWLKCPLCCPEQEDMLFDTHYPALLSGVKEYKPALSRVLTWSSNLYRSSLTKPVQCTRCGYASKAQIRLPEYAPTWLRKGSGRAIDRQCPACRLASWGTLESLVLSLPEGRGFWQRHPRIRTLPEHYIEMNGRAAVVTRLESVTDAAQFEVVSDYQTYDVFRIYGGNA